MNTSTFTTEQLRKAIPILVERGKGINTNECGYDANFCEFSTKLPIDISAAEEDKGMVYVRFKQHYTGDDSFDNMDAWTWEYSSVQVIEDINKILDQLS